MKTILLQSHKPPPWPGWITQCIESALSWARRHAIPTLFLHDELFDGLPTPFLGLTEDVILPRTDLGRLRWMKRLHDEGWDRVIWMDSDVFVFDQSLTFSGDAVGKEAWITRGDKGRFRVLRKINNCAMCFDAGSPHLERYLAAAENRAATLTAPPGRLDFGPDLMTPLHLEAPFPLHPDIAMFAPPVVRALAASGGRPLRIHEAVWGGAPKAANLCSSLDLPDAEMESAIRRLRSRGAGAARGPLDDYVELVSARDAPLVW